MPETPDTAEEIKRIRFRIEAIESTQEVILRHNAREYRDELLKLFEGDDALRLVYLAINGQRTQGEIVSYLEETGKALSQPTVSRRMTILADEGLIQQVEVAPSGGILWDKKDVMERVIRLSRSLANG